MILDGGRSSSCREDHPCGGPQPPPLPQCFARRSLRKVPVYVSLIPRYLTSRDFRLAFMSGVSANTLCFERELFDHFRVVFERA